MIWMPTGKPVWDSTGSESAGCPVILNGQVQLNHAWGEVFLPDITRGPSVPIGNAVTGDVGTIRTS